MTGAQLHMTHLRLKFGSYCQVAEDVTPRNSLAARTRAAISMGPSGNLSGGHRFLALDTGQMIVRNRWKELPMPTAVIDRVNVLGRTERSLLVFTDRQGRVIGVGAFSALASFMQPRWILTSIVVAVIWALMYKSRKVQALILVGVVGVMALAPAILLQRNIQSIDKAVISTNLGVTMVVRASTWTLSSWFGRPLNA